MPGTCAHTLLTLAKPPLLVAVEPAVGERGAPYAFLSNIGRLVDVVLAALELATLAAPTVLETLGRELGVPPMVDDMRLPLAEGLKMVPLALLPVEGRTTPPPRG